MAGQKYSNDCSRPCSLSSQFSAEVGTLCAYFKTLVSRPDDEDCWRLLEKQCLLLNWLFELGDLRFQSPILLLFRCLSRIATMLGCAYSGNNGQLNVVLRSHSIPLTQTRRVMATLKTKVECPS